MQRIRRIAFAKVNIIFEITRFAGRSRRMTGFRVKPGMTMLLGMTMRGPGMTMLECLQRLRAVEVGLEDGGIDREDLGATAVGVAVEPGVATVVPGLAADGRRPAEGPADAGDAGLGGDGERGAAVGELRDAEPVVAHARVAVLLFGGRFVRDGKVAVVQGVDFLHDEAELPAVRGRVLDPLPGDPVMDHLMDERVLDFRLRQIEIRADAQDEILATHHPAPPVAHGAVDEPPDEGAGVAELDRNTRKSAVETHPVECVEALLQVFDGWCHLITPNSLPTLMKAAMALSSCGRVWAAESCTRMRAWPFGTTG